MLTWRNIDNHDCQLCHLSRQSIHNIFNVPLEPERAAEARRAVVASNFLITREKYPPVRIEKNHMPSTVYWANKSDWTKSAILQLELLIFRFYFERFWTFFRKSYKLCYQRLPLFNTSAKQNPSFNPNKLEIVRPGSWHFLSNSLLDLDTFFSFSWYLGTFCSWL